MAPSAKIALSDAELALLLSTDWILTKQQVIEKTAALFNGQIPIINQYWSGFVNNGPFAELQKARPKISRGENYRGLPWMVLDYPSVFEKENVFALRTTFWWANFMSITLHISGKYNAALQQKIMNGLRADSHDFFICIHENQWHHHFGEDNYQPVAAANLVDFNRSDFLKIALRYRLSDWPQLPALLAGGYKKMAGLID